MCAWRRSALWPQVVAISLIGLGAAGCTDSGRFSDIFGTDSSSHSEVTGSIQQRAPAGRVETRTIPPVAGADNGVSGGGPGMGSYQPEITGAVRPVAPPPPTWTWEGGTPITVAPGETLEMIAHKHNVPMSAIMQANNIANPATVHAGQHLVIPRRSSSVAYAPPPAHVSTVPAAPPRTASPSEGVHVVAPGETLHSIAKLYGKPVAELAKVNNIAPDTMVRVGERLIIPDVGPPQAPRAEAPPPPHPDMANAESPHAAYRTNPVAPAPQAGPIKTAEPAGALPSFRWPVRGRVIAAFGPTPSGLQNDGIDLAVPAGTPVKAADDGIVAYAGSELKGYGNLVLIHHDNGYVTAYAHASEILVKRGETVKRGQVIAKSGDTGNVKSPELHFEIRKGTTPVDPSQFLNGA
jgi:murein DD-endopeptidase MepM/ murein hydrolase activator NlpD